MHELSTTFSQFLMQYGAIAIFLMLAIGILGLPIPDETLMLFSGILVAQGKLSAPTAFIAAVLGAMCGITVSYIIGRTAGHYIIERYGYWFGITHEKLQLVHRWFEKIGKWTLFFGYFIPGVRHLTGYVAGTTELNYWRFALFAYTGALLWGATFFSIGYFFGDRVQGILPIIDRYLFIILAIAIILLLFYYLILKRKFR